jgi:hypothetical protein
MRRDARDNLLLLGGAALVMRGLPFLDAHILDFGRALALFVGDRFGLVDFGVGEPGLDGGPAIGLALSFALIFARVAAGFALVLALLMARFVLRLSGLLRHSNDSSS